MSLYYLPNNPPSSKSSPKLLEYFPIVEEVVPFDDQKSDLALRTALRRVDKPSRRVRPFGPRIPIKDRLRLHHSTRTRRSFKFHHGKSGPGLQPYVEKIGRPTINMRYKHAAPPLPVQPKRSRLYDPKRVIDLTSPITSKFLKPTLSQIEEKYPDFDIPPSPELKSANFPVYVRPDSPQLSMLTYLDPLTPDEEMKYIEYDRSDSPVFFRRTHPLPKFNRFMTSADYLPPGYVPKRYNFNFNPHLKKDSAFYKRFRYVKRFLHFDPRMFNHRIQWLLFSRQQLTNNDCWFLMHNIHMNGVSIPDVKAIMEGTTKSRHIIETINTWKRSPQKKSYYPYFDIKLNRVIKSM